MRFVVLVICVMCLSQSVQCQKALDKNSSMQTCSHLYNAVWEWAVTAELLNTILVSMVTATSLIGGMAAVDLKFKNIESHSDWKL